MSRRLSQMTGFLTLAFSVSLLVNSCTYPVSAASANLLAGYRQQQPAPCPGCGAAPQQPADYAVFFEEARLIAMLLALLDSIDLDVNQLIDFIRACMIDTLDSSLGCIQMSKPGLTVRLEVGGRRGRRSCEAEERS